MSRQVWARENLVGYLAGGLTTEERYEMQELLAADPELAAALDELRGVDDRMRALFAAVKPPVALEDAIVQTLRRTQSSAVRGGGRPWPVGWIFGVAAVVLVAMVGIGALTTEEGQRVLVMQSDASLQVKRKMPIEFSGGTTLEDGRTNGRTETATLQDSDGEFSVSNNTRKGLGTWESEGRDKKEETTLGRLVPGSDRSGEQIEGKLDAYVGNVFSGLTPAGTLHPNLGKPITNNSFDSNEKAKGKYFAAHDPMARKDGGVVVRGGGPAGVGSGGGGAGGGGLGSGGSGRGEGDTDNNSKTRIHTLTITEGEKLRLRLLPGDKGDARSGGDPKLSAAPAAPPSLPVQQPLPPASQVQPSASKPTGGFGYAPPTNAAPPPPRVERPAMPKSDSFKLDEALQKPNADKLRTETKSIRTDRDGKEGKDGESDLNKQVDDALKSLEKLQEPGEKLDGLKDAKQEFENAPRDGDPKDGQPKDEQPKTDSPNKAPDIAQNKQDPDAKPAPKAADQKAPVERKQPEPPKQKRVVIRSGDIEFEVDSFDDAASIVSKLIARTKGGVIATTNSDKLPNGKTRGSIVVRMPPEELDDFVAWLRRDLAKIGELKEQRIGSQDVTKQYTDLESELRGLRVSEERLILMLKDVKASLKDLLAVETQLANTRTKIERFEGELRYYSNLAAMSTLTIKLYEKEIRVASAVLDIETVKAGVVADDVDKAFRDARAAIDELKGRVYKSELKQGVGGQVSAVLEFDVAPEQSGPMRDKLTQLGVVSRLDIDRIQRVEGGGTANRDSKVKRGDSQFTVAIYNLANVEPRETVNLMVVGNDVPGSYRKLRELVGKLKGNLRHTAMQNTDARNVSADLIFDVKRIDEPQVQAALVEAGEFLTRKVERAAESSNVTDQKVRFVVHLISVGGITAREKNVLSLAALDVPTSYRKIRDAVAKVKGFMRDSKLIETDKVNVSAYLDFDVFRADEAALLALLGETGETLSRNVERYPEGSNVTDAKVGFKVSLASVAAIPARETVTLRLVTLDVPTAFAKLRDVANDKKAQIAAANLRETDRAQVEGSLVFDVLRDGDQAIRDAIKDIDDSPLSRQVDRKASGAHVTDAKISYNVTIVAVGSLPARETVNLAIAAVDVRAAFDKLRDVAVEKKAQIVVATLKDADKRNLEGVLVFDVLRQGDDAIRAVLKEIDDSPLSRQVDRKASSANVTDLKVAYNVTIVAVGSLPARETVNLTIAAVDVPATYNKLREAALAAGAFVSAANLQETDRENMSGVLEFDVLRQSERAMRNELEASGEQLVRSVDRKPIGADVTDRKVSFKVALKPITAIPPRQGYLLHVKVGNVQDKVKLMQARVAEANGRTNKGPIVNQTESGKSTAEVEFFVPLASGSTLFEEFKKFGVVVKDDERKYPHAPDGKLAQAVLIVKMFDEERMVRNDGGFGIQLRGGVSTSLHWLSTTVSFLISALLFVGPWLVLLWVTYRIVRWFVIGRAVAPAETK